MSWLRRTAKAAVARCAWHSGALTAWSHARRAVGGPRVHVVGFHRVVDAVPPGVIPSLCISTRRFTRLMELAARRLDVLTLEQAVAALAGRRPLARDALVITFDDGYRDMFLRARVILKKLALPSVVFVPTGHVGTARPLLHDRLYALLTQAHQKHADLHAAPVPRLLRVPVGRAASALYRPGGGPLAALELLIAALPAASLARVADALDDLAGPAPPLDEGARVMSADELRACADDGMALGAHTVDHVVLTHEPPARVHRELARPRDDLAAIAGRPPTAFAYCNGWHSPSLVEAVRRAGYTAAVTTRDAPNRPGCDPLLLGRKVLCDGHVRGLFGGFATAQAAAQLHDLYGALGLTSPVDGGAQEEMRWRRSA